MNSDYSEQTIETDPHLTQAQLVTYRDGELYDPAVEAHITACALCRARLEESKRLVGLLRSRNARRSGRRFS